MIETRTACGLARKAWNAIGPSLLHRAFLIEALIARGRRELVFVHGCNGVLQHACLQMPVRHLWAMRDDFRACARAAALASLKPRTPHGMLANAAING